MWKHRKARESAEVQAEAQEAREQREQFEQERMTRRQALRKMGLTTGAAFFSLLTIDDLARASAKKLQEHEASRGIGDALAKEFRNAGVAFANPSGYNPSGGGGNPSGPNPSGPNPSGPNPSGPGCTQGCNDVASSCCYSANANYTMGSAAHTAAVDACFEQRDDCVAACNGGGGENPSGPPPNPSGPPPCAAGDDVCLGCQPDLTTGQIDCQQCLAGLASAGSLENIATAAAQAGVLR